MKIALIGTGKMGSAIEKLALSQGHEILYKINEHSLNLLHPEYLSKADIAIEFTSPDAAVNNLRSCLIAGVPVVCGSTGWQSQYELIASEFIEQNGTLFYASNFSIGVNLLFELNRLLSGWMSKLPEYSVSITEVHHLQKLDKPSGTAVTIANDIIKYDLNYEKWVLEENNIPKNKAFVPIEALRAQDVVGIHTINWKSAVDKITMHHEAYSREGFAAGVFLAALWLKNKKGVFTMKDLLFQS